MTVGSLLWGWARHALWRASVRVLPVAPAAAVLALFVATVAADPAAAQRFAPWKSEIIFEVNRFKDNTNCVEPDGNITLFLLGVRAEQRDWLTDGEYVRLLSDIEDTIQEGTRIDVSTSAVLLTISQSRTGTNAAFSDAVKQREARARSSDITLALTPIERLDSRTISFRIDMWPSDARSNERICTELAFVRIPVGAQKDPCVERFTEIETSGRYRRYEAFVEERVGECPQQVRAARRWMRDHCDSAVDKADRLNTCAGYQEFSRSHGYCPGAILMKRLERRACADESRNNEQREQRERDEASRLEAERERLARERRQWEAERRRRQEDEAAREAERRRKAEDQRRAEQRRREEAERTRQRQRDRWQSSQPAPSTDIAAIWRMIEGPYLQSARSADQSQVRDHLKPYLRFMQSYKPGRMRSRDDWLPERRRRIAGYAENSQVLDPNSVQVSTVDASARRYRAQFRVWFAYRKHGERRTTRGTWQTELDIVMEGGRPIITGVDGGEVGKTR